MLITIRWRHSISKISKVERNIEGIIFARNLELLYTFSKKIDITNYGGNFYGKYRWN